MQKEIWLWSFLWIWGFAACESKPGKTVQVASEYQRYCGACHLAPKPEQISQSVWQQSVLPEMMQKLGLATTAPDPLNIFAMEEELLRNKEELEALPDQIDSFTWHQIQDYILHHAPVAIPRDTSRGGRNASMKQFVPKPISLDEVQVSGISHIRFEPGKNHFILGDSYGRVYSWPASEEAGWRFRSPVIASSQTGISQYFTEIGYMAPSEEARGMLHKREASSSDTIVKQLHRPVYTEIADINGDGEMEILICEFGNLTGELSVFVKEEGGYKKRSLLPLPGTIKVEVADMDKDGKKDLVVLTSQGKEGVYILYQKADLQFNPEQVIEMGPEYGSSWFELMDYDQDGDLDIALVNGDNADYSIFLKPYHGLRLFLNDGANHFEEKWFYPIYGATRVLAADYDLDGDMDFAVMAFFPDFGQTPDESFVFLENQHPNAYQFQAYTVPESSMGRWLVMDHGDLDQDGDLDILLGSFLLPMENQYDTVMHRWQLVKTNLLLLENRARLSP